MGKFIQFALILATILDERLRFDPTRKWIEKPFGDLLKISLQPKKNFVFYLTLVLLAPLVVGKTHEILPVVGGGGLEPKA
jgi:hypothetical protein